MPYDIKKEGRFVNYVCSSCGFKLITIPVNGGVFISGEELGVLNDHSQACKISEKTRHVYDLENCYTD